MGETCNKGLWDDNKEPESEQRALPPLLLQGKANTWPQILPSDGGVSLSSKNDQELTLENVLETPTGKKGFGSTKDSPQQNDFSKRYAKIEHICPWFPEADPNHRRAQTLRTRLSRRRAVLLSACVTSTIVCLINFISTIVMYTKSHDYRLYHGKCGTTGTLSSVIHVGINLLSSILLGASNLCMQLLSAPTREEIDAAHKEQKWLDIGILSLRNLRHISHKRVVMLCVLAVFSLPLHFFYNSAIVSVQPSNAYVWALVTPEFVSGARFNVTATNVVPPYLNEPNPFDYFATITDLQRHTSLGDGFFTNLSTQQCLRHYKQGFNNASNVLLVSSTETGTRDNSLLASGYVFDPYGRGDYWFCQDLPASSCNSPKEQDTYETFGQWTMYGHYIDYCLSHSRTIDDQCSLIIIYPIMAVVIVCNICKCVCVYYTTWLFATNEGVPLTTVGDVAASFLKHEDTTTRSMCLADRENVEHAWGSSDGIRSRPQKWAPTPRRLWRIVSKRSWLTTMFCVGFLIIAAGVFLAIGMNGLKKYQGEYRPDIAHLGFGKPQAGQTSTMANMGDSKNKQALYTVIMWANSWQVAVSLVYVRYNALVTNCLVGEEWSRFACSVPLAETSRKSPLRVKKTLRVSAPEGIQRSSYFVSMPWRYGIPLISATSFLHWLISQSLFVIITQSYLPDGKAPENGTFYVNGYSIQASITAIVLGFIYFCFLPYLAARQYPGDIPMASSSSAAISAACHPPPEDNEAYLFPVQWGVVSTKDGVGHCSLTTDREVMPPEPGKLYA